MSSAAISRGLRGEHGRVSSLLRRDRNRRRGITAPLLFDKLIATEQEGQVAIGFLIGAPVMALGGVAELLFGVKAAGEQLEDIAQPLTAEDAEQDQPADTDATRHDKKQPEPAARRAAALHASEARIRRYRLGSGRMPTSRVPGVTSLSTEPALDNEVQSLQRALDEHGATERGELARLVGARYDTGNDDPAGESNPQP